MRAFIISLASSDERRSYQREQFGRLDIQWEFYDAVNGLNLRETEKEALYNDKACLRNHGRSLSAGEIGCALSHRKVYAEIEKQGLEHAIVFEDDVIIDDRIKKVIDWLDQNPLENSVVILGVPKNKLYVNKKPRAKLDDQIAIWKPIKPVWYAMGYYIHNRAAHRLLKKYKKVETVADNWESFKKTVRVFIVAPSMISIGSNNVSIIDSMGGRRK